jgi:hypothetical protein
MPSIDLSSHVRRLSARMRAAHRQDTQEWIRRMEVIPDRG